MRKSRTTKSPELRKTAEKKSYDKMYRRALNMDNLAYTPTLSNAQKGDLSLESLEINIKHGNIRGVGRGGLGAFAIGIPQEHAKHPDKMIEEILRSAGLSARQKIYIIRQYIRIFIKNMYSGKDGKDGFGKLEGERSGRKYTILVNRNVVTLCFDGEATDFFDESVFIRNLCAASRGRPLADNEIKQNLTLMMNMFEQSQKAIENKAKNHFEKSYDENMVSLKNIDPDILNGVEVFHEIKAVEVADGKTENHILIRDGKDIRSAASLRFGLFYERPPVFLVRVDDQIYQVESLTPVSNADGIKGYKIVKNWPSICAYMKAQTEITDAHFMTGYTKDIVRYYLAHPAFADKKRNRNIYFTYGRIRYELSIDASGQLVVQSITTAAGALDFIAEARAEFDAIESARLTPDEKTEELRKFYEKYKGLDIDRASLTTEQFMFFDSGREIPIEWGVDENRELTVPITRWDKQSRKAYRMRGKVEDRTKWIAPTPAHPGRVLIRANAPEQPFRSDADFQEHLLKHLLDSIRKKPE